MTDFRIEKDSMGEMKVPASALYAAQTQRAVENFPIGDVRFSRAFIGALGLIKKACAEVNAELGLLDKKKARAIMQAADEVADGKLDEHFPLVIFQTGSGTSTNMNANEVIANRANQILKSNNEDLKIHPNDDVNMGQSSNDVIPTAIHVSAYMQTQDVLLPGLYHLEATLYKRAAQFDHVVKTGRTHLMDATPVRLSQEVGGWGYQARQCIQRIESTLPRLARLPIGGTAVGTGINTHVEFGQRVSLKLGVYTTHPFAESEDHFAAQSAMDTPTELSGQLKTSASALMKIANDLRWMNSGPIAGLGEIALPSLQPGSSIMPGKVNPVICEAMMMVCAQVIGNDATITIGNERGNFQLNVMLPVIAHNLLQSIELLGQASRVLADKAVAGFTVNEARITDLIDKNPILVTALNPVIGYDKAAQIAKQAYKEGRRLKDVAAENTKLSADELAKHLDPRKMTEGGLESGGGGG